MCLFFEKLFKGHQLEKKSLGLDTYCALSVPELQNSLANQIYVKVIIMDYIYTYRIIYYIIIHVPPI